MKRASVILTDQTERSLLEWAEALQPNGPKPSLDLACTMALEEFAVERRDVIERLKEARHYLATGSTPTGRRRGRL